MKQNKLCHKSKDLSGIGNCTSGPVFRDSGAYGSGRHGTGWRNKGKISSDCTSPGTLKVHCYSSFVLQMRNCSCLAHLKMALVFETVIWISA